MTAWQKFVRKRNILVLIGLGGVYVQETKVARHWDKVFNYASLLLAIGVLVEWDLLADAPDALSIFQVFVADFSVWLFFILRMLVLVALVNNRQQFLQHNWFSIATIAFGAPILFADILIPGLVFFLRPFLALVLIAPSIRTLIYFFRDGLLRTTLLGSAIIIVVFGVLVAGVDPGIKTPWDGIWWALATVSTVGYGDVVPSSIFGRFIGAGLVIMGLGIFVVITANFLALILKKEVANVKKEERSVLLILKLIDEINDRQKDVDKTLTQISKRIKKIEKHQEK
jgi:voltage-gated potassium channel